DTEHNCVEAIGSEDFGANVFECCGALNRLLSGHVANDASDRRDQRIRIYAGVDEEAAAKDGTLFKRAIDGEHGTRNNVLVVNISSDADDAVGRVANPGDEFKHGIRPIDMPIDGILIGEHALCESLTDDSHGLLTFAVERVEIAAGDDGNAERGKESGRDGPQLPAR